MASQTLWCFECVCISWQSLLGLGLPLMAAMIYLPRVVREASIDDWLILTFATIFTYASKRVSGDGLYHEPWMMYIVVMWSMIACMTDRAASLRSLPLIWFLVFVSVLVPDVIGSFLEKPDGGLAIPGGRGLIDGLVLKPLMAVGVTALAYYLKVNPILPNKERRGKAYDKRSRDALLNISPRYRRPDDLDGKLSLIPKVVDGV